MKKISIVIFFMFSTITLLAENSITNSGTKKDCQKISKIIHKEFLPDYQYNWVNFGGCWYLYRFDFEAGTATPMNSTNYIGTTQICNVTSANVC